MKLWDIIIEILIKFGGSPGTAETEGDIVRFLLPSIFWTALLINAQNRWKIRKEKKEYVLIFAFSFGLFRELYMFFNFLIVRLGKVSLSFMHLFFPPFEHALLTFSVILLAYAFLNFIYNLNRFAYLYIVSALGITGLLYIITAIDWHRVSILYPGLKFGSYWGDAAFHLLTATAMFVPLYTTFIKFKEGMLHKLLFTAFLFFFLDEILMLINIAYKEYYAYIFVPIRHNLHIWAIPIFSVVYHIEIKEKLKRANIELEKQNDKLKALDKMKDGLIRDVTHELKTPVAKQKMQIELLKKILCQQDSNEVNRNKIINTIETSIKRQENVINNILNLYRLEEGGRKYQIKPVRLDSMLEMVLNDYQIMINTYKITIKKSLPIITINSDEEMIFHIFSNLINNAIKYRNQSGSPYIDVSIKIQENWALIMIADNGIGLTEEESSKIFEPFYQASSSFEGCGVGLIIAKIITEDLGGEIHLESKGKNQGTIAIVKLPLKGFNHGKNNFSNRR
ncbi:HAMP domain-containing histidine kinase [Candidatus Desantisbacteria bacterium]|nr:HAMP domain-containing histidine kinase [Candidatus Desantisbacteria bacterium]